MKYRIRKMTEREAWRLMGVKDEDFDKLEGKIPKSQLYKLAGNSIVTNVMMALSRACLLRTSQRKVNN